jgi:hypothetical protein
MTIIIDGTGTISGVSATGLTTAQTVGYSSLPAGSVLQVVNASTSSSVSNSTSTFADTGLTASITPKFATSKILVLINQNGITKAPSSVGTGVQIQLLRNSTVISKIQGYAGYNDTSSYNYIGGVSSSYLDSPATTSATTYKTQFKNEFNASNVGVNSDGSTSTITLMEIAV